MASGKRLKTLIQNSGMSMIVAALLRMSSVGVHGVVHFASFSARRPVEGVALR